MRWRACLIVPVLLVAACGTKTGLRLPDVTFDDARGVDDVAQDRRDAFSDARDAADVPDVPDVIEPLAERCVARRVHTTIGQRTVLVPGLDRAPPRGYRWQLDAQPTGSRSVLSPEDAPESAITPDRPGEYRVTVRVESQLDAGELLCPIVVTAALPDPRCPGEALVEPHIELLPAGRTQIGLDPAWIAVRAVPHARAGLVAGDDEAAAVSGVVLELPATRSLEEHAVAVESQLVMPLGAVPSLVGRTGRAPDGTPVRRSTYRLAPRAPTTPDAVRDQVAGLVRGEALARTPGLRHAAEAALYIELTTALRADAGMVYFLVAVASARAADDTARATATRVEDFVNGSVLAPAGRVNQIVCDLTRATRTPRADFLWFVDTSGSMNNDQQLVGQSAQSFFNELNAAGVDFRVGVLTAGYRTPALAGPPPFRWVSGADPMGARRMAFQVTSQAFGGDPTDTERPFPNPQGNEQPAAASILTVEELERRARAGEPNPEFRFRDDAVKVVFWVTDESGTNDDRMFFMMDAARWGTTVAARVARAAEFFRSREIIPFGLVPRTAGVTCDTNAANMLSCIIEAAGGAFVPINETRVAERDLAFRAAMSRVVSVTAGAVSEFSLSQPPISSSIRVRLVDRIVPRSRADGFDYEGTANALVFRGPTYRPRSGDEVRSAYFVWRAP